MAIKTVATTANEIKVQFIYLWICIIVYVYTYIVSSSRTLKYDLSIFNDVRYKDIETVKLNSSLFYNSLSISFYFFVGNIIISIMPYIFLYIYIWEALSIYNHLNAQRSFTFIFILFFKCMSRESEKKVYTQ